MATNEISTVVFEPKRDEPRGISLLTLSDFIEFGKMVAPTEFAPKSLRGKPADCALAVIYGSELGVSPMAALQNIAVINGKPSVWGDLMLALCMASPLCLYVKEWFEGEGDERVAWCETRRRGYENATRGRFGVDDAKRAGLWGKDTYKAYPDRMLQNRARGFALRDAFPDVLRGVISAEEAQDYPTTITVEPSSAVTSPPGWQGTNKPVSGPHQPPERRPTGPTGPRDSSPPPPPAAVNGGGDDAPLTFTERLSLFIRAAKTQTALANAVERADRELLAKEITKEQHDKLIELVNERADYLRSSSQLGEQSDG